MPTPTDTLTKAQFDLLAHAIQSGGSFALRDGPRAFGHVTGGRSAIAVLIRKGFFTRSNGSKGVPPVLTITPKGIEAHKAATVNRAA
jgi:hypothetical protein